jgi:hypothetical protein
VLALLLSSGFAIYWMEGKYSSADATVAAILEHCSVSLSHDVLYNAKKVLEAAANSGEPELYLVTTHRCSGISYSPLATFYLFKLMEARRHAKLAVYKSTIMTAAWSQIVDTEWQENWPNGLTNAFYHSFLHEFEMLNNKKLRPLDVNRNNWCTAENVKPFNSCVRDNMLKYNYAELNLDYDFESSGSAGEEMFVNDVGKYKMFSFDETKLNTSGKEAGSTKGEKTVILGENDDGACQVSAGSISGTGVGGGFGNGQSLIGYFVLAKKTLCYSDVSGGPITTHLGTGEEVSLSFHSTLLVRVTSASYEFAFQ